MPGLIRREDIDEVRSRTRIDDVVGDYVTLKSAGVDSKKGLCPFHDERTPSFHVRPQVGMYHCFGCGESGDVFSFLQKLDGLTFVEAVERLAERAGVQLTYEDGRGPDREAAGTRQRLVDMHQVAADFYREQLAGPAAQIARDHLAAKGFSDADAARFGVGFSPQSWDALTRHLRGRGFSTDDILAAGLVVQGRNGVYDRFRGRLMWPIRDITGRTIGFGARRLTDDDQGPKYLNTPETALYKKNQVLYGLDLAKRSIAKTKRVVIVEGYTDVMAAQLAGVEQAVATCGTTFGAEHIKIVRRLLGDDSASGGEVVFTFDGDEAGRAAALKAFKEDQRFVAQTFVAVEAGGMDPNELRIAKGDAAVRALIDQRRPLFEFALTSTIEQFDLSTVEGQVGAVRAAAPVIAGIRDSALRPGYERFAAGIIGVENQEVARAVRQALRRGEQTGRAGRPDGQRPAQPGHAASPPGPAQGGSGHPGFAPGAPGAAAEARGGRRWQGASAPASGDDPVAEVAHYQEELRATPVDATGFKVERGALQVALQQPGYVNAKLFDALNGKVFSDPAHRAVHQAMKDAGGIRTAIEDPANWPEKVREAADDRVRGLVGELAVRPLPAADAAGVERYARGIVARLFDKDMVRIAGQLHSRLQRTDPGDAATSAKLLEQLTILERQRERLRQLM
ncbi:DNA primase [Brevibacterium sp. BRM-1]|uniref:DNA primase n=1 Tax=Brevibacterium sp. BRM-1 TaxID=2999062 RepID=UPI00228102E5|nr:DNA primase [Brevibacterium sp. BRM-1]WAL41012.1 DNA primase [Brevibacterium sp. BRM-1]